MNSIINKFIKFQIYKLLYLYKKYFFENNKNNMGISFKNFDLLSPNITLYYKTQHRHSSYFSAFLTLFSILLIIIFSIIFGKDLRRTNPSAFFYNRFIEEITPLPYNSSGLFHLINVTDDQITYDSSRVFSIIGINNYMHLYDFNNLESFDHYIYNFCKENDIKGIEDVFDNTHAYNKLFCIKKFYNKTTQKVYNLEQNEYPYPQIINGASNAKASIYGIVIEKCKNSTIINNNNCYSEEIIDNLLKKLIGYSIDFLDHNILIENYKHPISNIYHTIMNQYNFGVGYTTNHLNFVPTMLKSNDGYFLDNIHIKNSYKFSYNEKLISLFSEEDNPNKGIFAAFYFWFQNQEDNFVRSYKRIQDILGSITGITKIIILIAKFINILIHKYIYLNDINVDIQNNFSKCFDKVTSSTLNHSPLIKIKNNNNLNSKLKFNVDKSNIQINNFASDSKQINENFKNSNNPQNKIKIHFWGIINNYFFKEKDQIITKLSKLRKNIISEEIMFQYYFIMHSKSLLFKNEFSDDLDLFNDYKFIINTNLNN